jgi:hypothetical protein
MTAELYIPVIVNVPALAVIEPRATNDVLAVIVEILAKPLMVRTPALAVTDPR